MLSPIKNGGRMVTEFKQKDCPMKRIFCFNCPCIQWDKDSEGYFAYCDYPSFLNNQPIIVKGFVVPYIPTFSYPKIEVSA